jgi:hypothetical protein
MVFLKFGSSRSQLELGFNVIEGVEKEILATSATQLQSIIILFFGSW